MKISLPIIYLFLLLISSCNNNVQKEEEHPSKSASTTLSEKKLKYARFSPSQIDGFLLDGYDVDEAYTIGSSLIITAYSDGDIEASNNPISWGDRLIHIEKDAIKYQSRPVGDPYLFQPTFYQLTDKDKTIILCQLGNEENYGAEVFLLEKDQVTFIGEIEMINPRDEENNNSLKDIIEISEVNETIYIAFDTDSIIYLGNEEEPIIFNDSLYYKYEKGTFELIGLQQL